ncbi:MAG: biopolymer transporter ExbD [Deltaproteobacteria bacterium]|nr:biopolymer transporter ExbD [Deltaproteobacteria bacterium]
MGSANTGKGGVADASLNVVPFIDLLACTICFLLISAAWTSLSRIDVEQALPKQQAAPTPKPKVEPRINVAITPTGYLVNLEHAAEAPGAPVELQQPKRIAALGTYTVCRQGAAAEGSCQGRAEQFQRYDSAGLRAALQERMKAAGLGAKVKVTVSPADEVSYVHLIATLDTVLTACADPAGTDCLKNPSVGDISLLRSAGFDRFD